MNDEELARNIEGARQVAEYFAGPFREKWHQVWQEGRAAQEQGVGRDANPHKGKVWRAVWEYGWDRYDPHQAFGIFAGAEEHLKTLPTQSI